MSARLRTKCLNMKLGKQRCEGAAAMAEGELRLEVDLGHGAVELGQVKEGIVAEAAGAPRCVQDHAFDDTIRGVRRFAVARGDQNATVSGGALWWRKGVKALKKDNVVPDIGVVVGVGRVDKSGIGGEAGRAHSWRAGEGVDFKAGVVGENELAGQIPGIVNGFERGVFGKGFAVFFGRVDVGEIGEGIDGNGVRFGGGAEVAQFALAGGGDVEAKGHQSKCKAHRLSG